LINLKAWFDTVRTVDRLLVLEKNHRELIDRQSREIQELKDRLTRLEESVKAREEILIAEAKGAAAAVGSAAAAQHVSDVSRRLGILEERTRQSTHTRLPPPADD
jgi:hypothetical protein